MTVLRVLAALSMCVAIYFGLGFEAIAGGRTLWPHAPAVVLVLVAWSLRTTPAILIAAVVGLGCDVIATGPLGPGLIAAVSASFVGSIARDRWELESPLAASLFGMAVAAGFLAGPMIVLAVARQAEIPAATLHLQLARAISSALAATAFLLIARIAGRIFKAMTGVLLNV